MRSVREDFVAAGPNAGHQFGLDKAKTIAALRALADDLDSTTYALLGVDVTEKMHHEDWVMTTLSIQVCRVKP